MKRIGILTAGGDTPALNATIHGAITRANQLRIEIVGLIKGFTASSTRGFRTSISIPFSRSCPRWTRLRAAP
jgi:6-phosphofructokinase